MYVGDQGESQRFNCCCDHCVSCDFHLSPLDGAFALVSANFLNLHWEWFKNSS